MADRHRKLGPFLTAALNGLPILYIASFGPACWMVEHGFPAGPTAVIYHPLLKQALLGEGPVRDAQEWYGDKCSAVGMVEMGVERGLIDGGFF